MAVAAADSDPAPAALADLTIAVAASPTMTPPRPTSGAHRTIPIVPPSAPPPPPAVKVATPAAELPPVPSAAKPSVGPAGARGLAPATSGVTLQHTKPANDSSVALKRNLWHGADVNVQVSQALTSANQFGSLSEADASIGALPSVLWQRASLFGASVLARMGVGPDMSAHAAPESVPNPGPHYRVAHYIAAEARALGVGNCGEKAMSAAVMMADRGLEPVEVFALAEGDHGFCVVGRAPGSDPARPETWGPNAVIVDPWANESYPVATLVAEAARPEGTSRMRGLIHAGMPLRMERMFHVAGEDPNTPPEA